MKIGIVTITDPIPNYGNKLQNYASVQILKRLGAHPVTLRTKSAGNNFKLNILACFINIFGSKLLQKKPKLVKRGKFFTFDKKYLNPCDDLLKGKDIKNQYDYFAVGSDQVWNANWYDDFKKNSFLLNFADDKQKICISPSFGIDKLPKEYIENFTVALKKFPLISVREESGAKIIKDLTGRDSEVVLDPTLLLDKNDWKKIAKVSKARKEKYILIYMLDSMEEKDYEYIKQIAKENSLDVIRLLDYKNLEAFMADPCEFLDLIENAELVVTNSFHANVFSIIFEKPFLNIERKVKNASEKMNSRITTLHKKLGLESRNLYEVSKEEMFICDYSKAYVKLDIEKNKAIEFLKKSINL